MGDRILSPDPIHPHCPGRSWVSRFISRFIQVHRCGRTVGVHVLPHPHIHRQISVLALGILPLQPPSSATGWWVSSSVQFRLQSRPVGQWVSSSDRQFRSGRPQITSARGCPDRLHVSRSLGHTLHSARRSDGGCPRPPINILPVGPWESDRRCPRPLPRPLLLVPWVSRSSPGPHITSNIDKSAFLPLAFCPCTDFCRQSVSGCPIRPFLAGSHHLPCGPGCGCPHLLHIFFLRFLPPPVPSRWVSAFSVGVHIHPYPFPYPFPEKVSNATDLVWSTGVQARSGAFMLF